MTAVVSKTILESQAWQNMFEIINNRSYIADPRGSTATSRIFVYDSDPLQKSLDFSGLPYIILEMPELKYEFPSAISSKSFLTWTFRVIVRTAKDGAAGSRTNTGRKDLMDIGDDLHATFNSNTIKAIFKQYRMEMVKIRKISTDTLAIDQRQIFEAEYEIESKVRLEVT